jgi:hypothetical protein
MMIQFDIDKHIQCYAKTATTHVPSGGSQQCLQCSADSLWPASVDVHIAQTRCDASNQMTTGAAKQARPIAVVMAPSLTPLPPHQHSARPRLATCREQLGLFCDKLGGSLFAIR